MNYYLGATVHYPTLFGRPFTPTFSVYTERQGQYQAYLRTTRSAWTCRLHATLRVRRRVRFAYTFERGSTKAEPVVLCAIFSRCTPDEIAEVQRELPLGIASVVDCSGRAPTISSPRDAVIPAGIETRYSAPVPRVRSIAQLREDDGRFRAVSHAASRDRLRRARSRRASFSAARKRTTATAAAAAGATLRGWRDDRARLPAEPTRSAGLLCSTTSA